MRWGFFFFFAVRICFGADFDCVFVGTSPIPLFEALYQRELGKKVLILEKDSLCGGAWKGISICGIEHVDLGCHQIGYNVQLQEFLEVYAGCTIVPMDHPKDLSRSFGTHGLYFSKGCYELIEHLVQLISRMGISLSLNHQLESVFVDLQREELILKTSQGTFTTKQLFYTQFTSFAIENPPSLVKFSNRETQYHHLYLLISDPTPPQFSYQSCGFHGASRMMNLTHFLGLEPLGRQLIVFQVNSESALQNSQLFLDTLKGKRLVSTEAYILKEEPYTYKTGCAPQRLPSNWDLYFHNLQTASFLSMTHHIARWKKILKPFREIFP